MFTGLNIETNFFLLLLLLKYFLKKVNLLLFSPDITVFLYFRKLLFLFSHILLSNYLSLGMKYRKERNTSNPIIILCSKNNLIVQK